jgi:hypothetical protein
MPVRAACDEGAVLRLQPRDAPQACGPTAFESYETMTVLPDPVMHESLRRRSPVEGLDYGGPAVVEPKAP